MNNNWHSNISSKNREDIIFAAKELFLKNITFNVKVTDICTLAGISRVTFYKYFKTMDELIFEVQIDIINCMAQFIKERSDFTRSGKESLKSVLYSWIDFAKAHKEEMKFIVLFDLYYSSYDLNEELKLKYKNFAVEDFNRSILRTALDKGIRDGSLKLENEMKASKIGTYVFQTAMGLLQRLSYTTFNVEGEDITFEDIATQVVDMIIAAVENKNN